MPLPPPVITATLLFKLNIIDVWVSGVRCQVSGIAVVWQKPKFGFATINKILDRHTLKPDT
jgi:hypothetical protein